MESSSIGFAELMVLGFISLILTFSQTYIAKICIPNKAADSMLPCPLRESTENTKDAGTTEGEHRRRLLWNEHRFLAGGSSTASCKEVSEIAYTWVRLNCYLQTIFNNKLYLFFFFGFAHS